MPPNMLTFSLSTSAPAGATINPGNGFFTWTPSESQGGATYNFAAIVSDNGAPPLSATQSVAIVVLKTKLRAGAQSNRQFN